jgi:hypothetical protein
MKKQDRKELEELEAIVKARAVTPIDENKQARDRLKATLHQLADDLADVLSAPMKPAPEKTNDEFEIFSPEQLTERLGVVKDTLATWRREGRGPKFFKEGRNVFYRANDVRDWINQSPTYTKTVEQWMP